MGYVSDFSSDFGDDPVLANFYSTYDLFKQAVAALSIAASQILQAGGSDALMAAAQSVASNPIGKAQSLMFAFCADATIQATINTPPSDADMLAAATWIITQVVSD